MQKQQLARSGGGCDIIIDEYTFACHVMPTYTFIDTSGPADLHASNSESVCIMNYQYYSPSYTARATPFVYTPTFLSGRNFPIVRD